MHPGIRSSPTAAAGLGAIMAEARLAPSRTEPIRRWASTGIEALVPAQRLCTGQIRTSKEVIGG